MAFVKKDRAGSDSFGNVWDKDGDVVETDDKHAELLVRIPDGGFTKVEAPAKSTTRGRKSSTEDTAGGE